MSELAAWQRLQPFVDKVIPRARKQGLGALPERDQILFLVWSATAEFDNGGFAQFFYNTLGEHSKAAVGAFRRIGAEEVAELLEQAIEVFPHGEVPADIDERNEALAELPDDRFQELDEEFQSIGSDAVMDQLVHFYLDRRDSGAMEAP